MPFNAGCIQDNSRFFNLKKSLKYTKKNSRLQKKTKQNKTIDINYSYFVNVVFFYHQIKIFGIRFNFLRNF